MDFTGICFVVCLSLAAVEATVSVFPDGSCRNDGDCAQGECDIDHRCKCYVNWTPPHCLFTNLDMDHKFPCNHFVCSDHGHCHNYGGLRKCVCDPGWKGLICDIPTDGHFVTAKPQTATTTTTHHVSGETCGYHRCYHGRCSHDYHCSCYSGWSDFQCNTDESICNPSICIHGECQDSKCLCHAGWTGTTCETSLHVYSCDDQPCFHGNCVRERTSSHQACKCLSGWTGLDCNTQVTVSRKFCGRQSCYHGDCHAYYNNYGQHVSYCRCSTGWTGHSCSKIATRCGGSHAHICHHGICHTDLDRSELYCICEVGWTGRDCNTRESVDTTTTKPLIPSTIPTTQYKTTTTTTTTTTPTTTTTTTTTPTTTTTTTPSTTTSTTTTTTPTTTSTTTTPTTTTTSTTASTTTSTTTKVVTTQSTTALPLDAASCPKFGTINDIANTQISSNKDAISCNSGNKTSPEAFVLNHCNVTSPDTWKEGINVMSDCNSIPTYTPIASFGNHRYSSIGTLCGIFIGCLSDGFKMVVQHCDKPPAIEHIITNNGLFARDPTTYFTVML